MFLQEMTILGLPDYLNFQGPFNDAHNKSRIFWVTLIDSEKQVQWVTVIWLVIEITTGNKVL